MNLHKGRWIGVGLAWLTLMPGAAGQEKATREHRIFEIKYADPRRLLGLLEVLPLCGNRWDEVLRTISVCTTSPEYMKAVEDTIRRFDVPPSTQNVEFTIYMMLASADPAKAGPVPSVLEPVVKEMSANFAFKSYRLADTLQVRTRDGNGSEVNSVASQPGVDGQRVFYHARFSAVRVTTSDKGKRVRVDNFRVGMRVPYRSKGTVTAGNVEYQYTEVGFNTDIDINENQKAVVGRANVDGHDAMVVVVVPRVVE